MLTVHPQPVNCSPVPSLATLDILHSDALRARDLLVGALALLRRDGGVDVVRELVAQARVSAVALVDVIERAVAVEHERVRSENQRLHGQAIKHVGAEVPR